MRKLIAIALVLAAAGLAAADVRQLKAGLLAEVAGHDGKTYRLETLGNPMAPKASEVEFVTARPDGSKIVWGVISTPGRHGVIGADLRTGEAHWIDTTADFGPHAHRTELAPYGNDTVYVFSGTRFRIYKYSVSNRKKTLLHSFPKWTGRFWIAARAVGPDGKIYVGTYPRTIAIGVDPATDKAFQLPPMTTERDQKYLAAPAVDDDNVMYAPVGRKRPELFSYDLNTGVKKQLLTPEETAALIRENVYIPSVFLWRGRVYTTIGEQRYLCTPSGLEKASSAVPWPEHPDRVKANGRFPAREIGGGETAVAFGDHTVIVERKDGTTRTIRADIPYVPHEIYRFGDRRGDVLFGSGIFRAKVFGLDLKTLKATDYGRCSTGTTQSYDLQDTPHGLLISSYTGATLDLFEPNRPKSADNPVPLAKLEISHQQERIPRLTRVGKLFYGGCQPIKGHLGGAVVRIDPAARNVTVFRNVIPDQSISDLILCPDGKTLFGNASILGGTGSTPKAKTPEVFLWDTGQDRLVWHDAILPEAICFSESGLTADGHVITFGRSSSNVPDRRYFWLVFDPVRRVTVDKGSFPAVFKRYLVSHPYPMGPQKRNYFAADGTLYAYDPGLRRVVKLFSHPSLDLTQDLVVTKEGYAYYFADNTAIIRVKLF